MQTIRFLQIGDGDIYFIYNLANQLNTLQDSFFFDIGLQKIPIGVKPIEGFYDEDKIDARGAAYARKHHPREYPISICDIPIRNELCTSFDADSALVNLYQWTEKFPNCTKDKILAFQIVDILITRRITTPTHSKARGCPSDYCESSIERVKALLNSEFCSECQSIIKNEILLGAISPKEVASIFRILDWIADRRRIFVIMPFGDNYSNVYYSCIRPLAQKFNWTCIRGDEVRQLSEIIDLIFEEIYRASLIIADLSDSNTNVFYELGYAHAIGKRTILLCQSREDIPFDLRHRQILFYSSNEEGLNRLTKELNSYLE
jgi:hypothetical protein